MNFSIVLVIGWLWQWISDVWRVISLVWMLRTQPAFFKRKTAAAPEKKHIRFQPKPEWVKKEIIRLKALMIHDGSRKIADTFNRLYQDKKRMAVGKTFVCETVKKHLYEIKVLRRKIKHKKPRLLPKNLIWSLDLTQVRDDERQAHTLFGIVDAGSRACLHLHNIHTKASIMLLRCLLDTIEKCGKPKFIRTDNERIFTSCLFRFGLWLVGIKHQRTEVCCPWQNGKVERFFGTLKEKLKHYTIPAEQLAADLALFRIWYNHIRPHQHLNGKTPAETWYRQQPNPNGKHFYFEGWNGTLTGLYLPPT